MPTTESKHRLAEYYIELARNDPSEARKRLGYFQLLIIFYSLLVYSGIGILTIEALFDTGQDDWSSWGIGIFGALWLIFGFIGFFLPPEIPGGIRVTREDAPGLFEEIDRLCEKFAFSEEPQVILEDSPNAFAAQQPIFGFFGAERFTLGIGQQLLALLSRDELSSVLAHEFAHFKMKHGKGIHWWLRVGQSIEIMGAMSPLIRFMFRPLDALLERRVSALKSGISRQNEIEADRIAADTSTPHHFASALMQLALVGKEFEMKTVPSEVATDKDVGGSEAEHQKVIRFFKEWSFDPERHARHVAIALAERSDLEDSHPPLIERLSRIGAIRGTSVPEARDDMIALLSARSGREPRACDLWVADFGQLVSKNQNEDGLDETDHAIGEWLQSSLDTARSEKKKRTLSPEEEWKLVSLIYDVEGWAQGKNALMNFCRAFPEHQDAQLLKAIELYEEGDEHWNRNVRIRKESDPSLRLRYLEALRSWNREIENTQEVAALEAQIFEATDFATSIDEIRAKLPRGAKVVPHGLGLEATAQLVDQLASREAIKGAWLVERCFQEPSMKKQFVLLVRFKAPRWTLQDNEWEIRNAIELESRLFFPHDIFVYPMKRLCRKLRSRVSNQQDSLIYKKVSRM